MNGRLLCCLYKLNYGILARIFLELFVVMSVTCLEVLNYLVSVHGMLADVDDTNGNVGAMVTHALKVGYQIRPDKSGLNGAGTISESYDMVITKECFESVNNLLQRFNVVSGGEIIVEISHLGQGDDLTRCGTERGKLLFGGRRELDALLTKLLDGFQHVDGVVGDTLEVTDRFTLPVSFSLQGLPSDFGYCPGGQDQRPSPLSSLSGEGGGHHSETPQHRCRGQLSPDYQQTPESVGESRWHYELYGSPRASLVAQW